MMHEVTASKVVNHAMVPEQTIGKPQLFEILQQLNFSHLLYFWAVARDGSIASACDRLQISQPTISMQIRKLERSLGHRLFDRSGRNLALTNVGRTVFDYADEMFSIGREMLGTLRGMPGKRSGRFHVGIPTSLPKLITHRLLAPILEMPQQIQLICHEADINELVTGLTRHKYDTILTDTPIPPTLGVRTYNHLLGECDIAFCAAPQLAAKYREGFPQSLADSPVLLPTALTDLRRVLDRWFDDQPFAPQLVAEFDDSALMKEFGGNGSGLFPVPSAVLHKLMKQYGVELVGRLPEVKIRYYVATTERKLTHPAAILIAKHAKTGLLGDGDRH
jgi:LysR family transcriptional activator of nhaA